MSRKFKHPIESASIFTDPRFGQPIYLTGGESAKQLRSISMRVLKRIVKQNLLIERKRTM